MATATLDELRNAGSGKPGVFVSYRREDSAGEARSLYKDLKARGFRVFMDLDSIGPGEHFPTLIQQALASTSVLISVIGPDWLVDRAGRRRLDDPEDYVRIETERALAAPNCRVIPVLVHGASLPARADLPESLRDLVSRNAFEIRDTKFDLDAGELATAVHRVLASAEPSLSIELSDEALAVEPGHTESALVVVRNDGVADAAVALEVRGPEWVRLVPAGGRLRAGDHLRAHVVAEPPRRPDVVPGGVAYVVMVRPDTGESLQARGELDVRPYTDVQVSPTEVRLAGHRQASFELTVRNGGNAPVPARITGPAPGERVRVVVDDGLTVAPGDVQTRPVRVSANRLHWTGRPVEHPFPVTVTAGGDNRQHVVEGVFRQRAVVPLLALALAVVLVAGVVGWYLRPGAARATKMPVVVGLTETDARARLSDAGLESIRTTSEPVAKPSVGRVLRSVPTAGSEISTGTDVTLVVGSPVLYVVARVHGKSQGYAAKQLGALFEVVWHNVPDPDVAAGRVIRTSPSEHSRQPRGTRIDVYVSTGQPAGPPGPAPQPPGGTQPPQPSPTRSPEPSATATPPSPAPTGPPPPEQTPTPVPTG